MSDTEAPTCTRCGAPVETSAMAALCPHREQCAFWPDDEESQRLLDSFGWRLPAHCWPGLRAP